MGFDLYVFIYPDYNYSLFHKQGGKGLKIKKGITALLLCSAVALFSGGCSVTDFSADNLLRPPKAMGDEAEIEQLISKTANENYTLKYPKSGSYRSAIIMTDLNGDENNEAIAFYRSGDDTTQIHMLVMYSDKDEWKLSSDNITEAADVDSVDFADIDGSGTLEIFAGFTTYTPNINRLSCYSYKDGKTSEIQSGHSYSSFYTGDFDNDGYSEIMTLLLKKYGMRSMMITRFRFLYATLTLLQTRQSQESSTSTATDS